MKSFKTQTVAAGDLRPADALAGLSRAELALRGVRDVGTAGRPRDAFLAGDRRPVTPARVVRSAWRVRARAASRAAAAVPAAVAADARRAEEYTRPARAAAGVAGLYGRAFARGFAGALARDLGPVLRPVRWLGRKVRAYWPMLAIAAIVLLATGCRVKDGTQARLVAWPFQPDPAVKTQTYHLEDENGELTVAPGVVLFTNPELAARAAAGEFPDMDRLLSEHDATTLDRVGRPVTIIYRDGPVVCVQLKEGRLKGYVAYVPAACVEETPAPTTAAE